MRKRLAQSKTLARALREMSPRTRAILAQGDFCKYSNNTGVEDMRQHPGGMFNRFLLLFKEFSYVYSNKQLLVRTAACVLRRAPPLVQ